MLLFPNTTWLSVERASPFWWEEISWKCYPSSFLSSELGRVTPLQLKRLVDVKNCFASKNWDLLHYYLLFQDPFFCFGPHPQYRYGCIRTIGCATLHTTKKSMSDFHFEEIHKSVQLLQGAGCQKFRTKRQISKSENTQDLQSDDKSAVKVCCPSNVSLMLCNSSLTPIHLQYTCTVAATEYLVSDLKWKKTLLVPRYLFFA